MTRRREKPALSASSQVEKHPCGVDVMSPEIAAAATNDHLQLIVNPTERCNLRCVYCYETFALGKMPQTVISGLLNLVRRRAEKGLKTFRLEFFGGEPLVAWDVVETLSRGLFGYLSRQWNRDARRHDDQRRAAHALAARSARWLRGALVPGDA